VVYPFLFVVPLSITYDENTTTYQVTLIFADRLNENLDNEVDCISDSSLNARNFLSQIRRGNLQDYFDITLPQQAQPFLERFNDNVAGVALDANIIVYEDINACPPYPTPTPSPSPQPPVPVCPPALTGECPSYVARYSPNYLYLKNSGQTASFVASGLTECAVYQYAMTNNRIFSVDGCSNYRESSYVITEEGCMETTFIKQWKVWDKFPATPNASFTCAVYDSNTLIIGESASIETQTGSTLYLYNLTTSGLTKWLELGEGAVASQVYYNTGTTQMLMAYGSASGGTGYYALYSGSTNPQLLSRMPVVSSIAGGTYYFSGDTPIAVNAGGIQYALDFVTGTQTLLENSSGIPIFYVYFNDGFGYIANIVSPVSCYNWNIQWLPGPTPTPSVTPTFTPTSSVTPTVTPTNTNTPSPTPSGGLPPGVYAFAVSTGSTQGNACSSSTINVTLYGNKQFWFDYNPTDTFYLNTGLTIPAGTYYAKYAPQNTTWNLVNGMPQPAGYQSC
jgi:hypothetical protein